MNNMNDYDFLKEGRKNQTLILVEGEHEKQILLSILLSCFPEIPLLNENIHVYAADIYDLYYDIEKEYEEDWYEGDLEIDLPMLISRRHNIEPQLKRKNFTNIILMFDYEHHDIWYSDEKIKRMQEHFNNISEDGILYINYPMIEAYKDIVSVPDETYLRKYVSVQCQPGKKYKQNVDRHSVISKYFYAYEKLLKYIREKISGIEEEEMMKLVYDIFAMKEKDNLRPQISSLLSRFEIENNTRVNMEYSIENMIKQLMYLDENLNYWEKLRQIFIYIVEINIEKGMNVQTRFEESKDSIKDKYLNLDWFKILEEQNMASHDKNTGIIWILCSCVTILAEYKFYWSLNKNGL